jgi:hypothetical protein
MEPSGYNPQSSSKNLYSLLGNGKYQLTQDYIIHGID